jgi:hypothetical protein
MTFKAGTFASNATCTAADLELEAAINAKLKLGRVTLWTIVDPRGNQYAATYAFRGKTKVFTRRIFEIDLHDFIEGLMITAQGMENTKLPRGWVDDADEADQLPDYVEDFNATL